MADTKVSALTELTTFSGDETLYVVEDDDGTPASRRVTVENLATGLAAQQGMAWALQSITTVRRTAGDLNLQTATVAWANTSTALDLTAAAASGDRARVSLVGLCSNEARDGFIDAVTLVSAAPVNSFANQGAVTSGPPFYGIPSWRGNTSTFNNLAGSMDLVLGSGDIDGGNVTIRFRSCTSTNGAKTLHANSNYALTVQLEVWTPIP